MSNSRVQTDIKVIEAHMEAAEAFPQLDATLRMLKALGLDASRITVTDAFTMLRSIKDVVRQAATDSDRIREAIRP